MSDRNGKESKEKNVFERINKNYNNLNKMMVEEMKLASEHDSTTGNYREEMWVKFFRSMLPQKFSLAQGVLIIDSGGHVSKEVDIAVFDEQYTPYVFQYNTLKFIPIEAVALVIECKSSRLTTAELKNWAQSIDDLCASPSGVARLVGGYVTGLTNTTQKSTRPIKVLASLKQSTEEKAMEKTKAELGDHFDFIIQQVKADQKVKGFEVLIKNEDKPLGWWGKSLNNAKNGQNDDDKKEYLKIITNQEFKDNFKSYTELKFVDEEFSLKNTLKDLEVTDNPLLSLNFQLNQLLMLLNNPMLFPHFAYARMFNEQLAKAKEMED